MRPTTATVPVVKMSMEDFLFGSDLEDSDEEEKTTKPPKKSEQDAQMNELFGDSPSEGEDEVEDGGARDSESDKEESESGEEREERKNLVQEGEDGDNQKDNEVRNEAAAF